MSIEVKIVRYTRNTQSDWLLFSTKEFSFIQKACNHLFYLPLNKDKGLLTDMKEIEIPNYIKYYSFSYIDKGGFSTGIEFINRPVENKILKEFLSEIKVKKRIRKHLRHNQREWSRFRLEAETNRRIIYPKLK